MKESSTDPGEEEDPELQELLKARQELQRQIELRTSPDAVQMEEGEVEEDGTEFLWHTLDNEAKEEVIDDSVPDGNHGMEIAVIYSPISDDSQSSGVEDESDGEASKKGKSTVQKQLQLTLMRLRHLEEQTMRQVWVNQILCAFVNFHFIKGELHP